ncbi:MAG TPA: hypothetical protein VF256_04675, partial [Streptosporangiaceae bacterium]
MTQPDHRPRRALQLTGVAVAVALLTGGVALVPRLVSAPSTTGASPDPSAATVAPMTSATPSASPPVPMSP